MSKVILLLLFLPCLSIAKPLKGHPIYNQIIDNNPDINRKNAMNLSNIIYRKARKFDIDARLLTAILAQETMYRMVQGSCSTGYIKIDIEYTTVEIPQDRKLKLKDFSSQKTTICEDFGIGQINYRNIEKFEMDKERLLTDLDYSVEMAAFMLKTIKQYYGNSGDDWWTRYNTYSHAKRKVYKNQVKRYF